MYICKINKFIMDSILRKLSNNKIVIGVSVNKGIIDIKINELDIDFRARINQILYNSGIQFYSISSDFYTEPLYYSITYHEEILITQYINENVAINAVRISKLQELYGKD